MPFSLAASARNRSVNTFRIRDLLAIASACLRDLAEVRLHLEIGVYDPVAHAEFLNVADRAECAIVEYAPGDAKPIFGGHWQDMQHHLKGAVADESDRWPIGINLPRDRKSRAGEAHAVEARWHDQAAG